VLLLSSTEDHEDVLLSLEDDVLLPDFPLDFLDFPLDFPDLSPDLPDLLVLLLLSQLLLSQLLLLLFDDALDLPRLPLLDDLLDGQLGGLVGVVVGKKVGL